MSKGVVRSCMNCSHAEAVTVKKQGHGATMRFTCRLVPQFRGWGKGPRFTQMVRAVAAKCQYYAGPGAKPVEAAPVAETAEVAAE